MMILILTMYWKDNCYITTLHEQAETLESYYINLVGGANHE